MNTEKLRIPDFSMVVLVGASGSGKSTFGARHFLPSQVLSSDMCRAWVSDDANDQSATSAAFALLHHMLGVRLSRRLLTVIDATNVQRESRQPLLRIAREHHCIPVAIVLDVPEALCQERNAARPDRDFGPHVVRHHTRALKRSLKQLRKEGFRHVYVIRDLAQLEELEIVREPLWTDRRAEHGPFDIIGDVHGCFEELTALLGALGYQITARDAEDFERGYQITPPEGRRAIFVGDLVDRGPSTPQVLSLAMSMVEQGAALCVSGNHDAKLLRALRGKKVTLNHGLDRSMAQLETCSPEFRERVITFLDGLLSHYMLAGGALCVAHAGLREDLQGRASGKVRSFALYGETTGEVDSFGLPVRHDWAAEYRGQATVVYGHTPTPRAEWINDTLCLDTGCVFGGKLSALRWPERELHEVEARQVWCEPTRPLETSQPTETEENPSTEERAPSDLLDWRDVSGKQVIATELGLRVMMRAEQSAPAMEVMSRFGIDPRWLITLPPTMSPCETSPLPGYLEHPEQALDYYARRGVSEVMAQVKHMGSRALMIVLERDEVACERFGFDQPSPGVIFTRTGRRFFKDGAVERALLERVRQAMTRAGLWQTLETGWVCLDCELMPWSAKAEELLLRQYAPVGEASRRAMAQGSALLAQASARQIAGVETLRERHEARAESVSRYADAYRPYCWEVTQLEDHRIAPFHVLASEGRVHMERPHSWHMALAKALSEADDSGVLMCTAHRVIDPRDEAARQELVAWWEEVTSSGGEGLVFKPMGFTVRHEGELVQPAIKCRGKEYLRLIYGPEYDLPHNLERLKQRNVGRKRALALREYALGHQALHTFVTRQGLRRVHQAAFGVLALESSPIDPRL